MHACYKGYTPLDGQVGPTFHLLSFKSDTYKIDESKML